MKIAMIHGQNHQGSTCHIARMLAKKLGGEVKEFFLPRDFSDYCVGCTMCFTQTETKCPHYEKLLPFTKAMDEADVLIFASPVYVYHITGPMKSFFDHYGWRWMVHRPEEKMFSKQAVCISTAAGAGMKSTNKDIADSMFFWGVGKTYRYGAAIHATSWKAVGNKQRRKIEAKMDALAEKIKKRQGKVTPSLKTKLFFFGMSIAHKKGMIPADDAYWREKGWTGRKRPWK